MNKHGMQGFTLVELAFCIAIMALIVGFAPLGADMVRRERVVSATKELYADLQKVRLDSLTQDGMGYGIRFESENTYVIFKFNDCNNDYNYDADTCGGNAREETDVTVKTIPSMVSFKKTNPHTDVNNDILMFDRFGVPRGARWGLGLLTIVVKSDSDDTTLMKCISVSTNRVREGVWGWDRHEGKYACLL